MDKYKKGFTLAEVLVALMIIGVIAVFIMNAVKIVKDSYTALAYYAHKNIVDVVGILYGGTYTSTDRKRVTCKPGSWINGDEHKTEDGKEIFVPRGKLCPETGYFYTYEKLGADLLKDEFSDKNLKTMVTRCTHSNGKIVNVLKTDNEKNTRIVPCSERDKDEQWVGETALEQDINLFCKSFVSLTNNSNTDKDACKTKNLFSAVVKPNKDPYIENLQSKLNKPNFTANNGMRYYITKWDKNDYISNDYGFRLVAVDLNGKQLPNKVNNNNDINKASDIVTFLVLDNGEVYPLGIAADDIIVNYNGGKDENGNKKTYTTERRIQYLRTKVKGYYFSSFNDSSGFAANTGERVKHSETHRKFEGDDLKSSLAAIPDECKLRLDKKKFKTEDGIYEKELHKCDFRVINVANPDISDKTKKISKSIYTYRQALCSAKGKLIGYQNYAPELDENGDELIDENGDAIKAKYGYCYNNGNSIEQNNLCQPSSLNTPQVYNTCQVETIKPAFRFKF